MILMFFSCREVVFLTGVWMLAWLWINFLLASSGNMIVFYALTAALDWLASLLKESLPLIIVFQLSVFCVPKWYLLTKTCEYLLLPLKFQVYKGKLTDGTLVAIRSLNMRRRQRSQSYMHHIELISKLRHCHLVSALGHCFECFPDDSCVNRIFLLSESAPNRSLRSCISGKLLIVTSIQVHNIKSQWENPYSLVVWLHIKAWID